MLKELRNNPRALALAVAVHVALIAALLVSLDWTHKPAPIAAVATVQATVVDETKVRAEQEKLNEAERRKQEEERQRLQQLQQEAKRAKQAREQEQQRLKQLEQETEQARRERAQEQQRLAELETQRKAEAEQQRLAQETAGKDEQRRLAELEEKRKIEAEKKRQEEQARREQQLKNQLAAEEQAAVQQAREGEDQRIIAQYISLIEQKVKRNWHKPASATAGMSCTVRVRLLPGGEVSDARVVISSGDELFDRSVESAVYRASPLPLPPDAVLFDKYFRDLNFIFRP